MSDADQVEPSRDGVHWRRGDEPEFGRVVFFSDAVFAIALTLLALDLRVTDLRGDPDAPASMLSALDGLVPQLVAYGVGFLLLAKYWLAHHRFMSRVGAIDGRFMGLNLTYLGFVALLPFPTALIGEYESNPISGVAFALALATVSLMETVLLVHAHRAGLFIRPLSDAQFRHEALASTQPAIMFVITIPIAFISPTYMLLSWLVVAPLMGWLLTRSGVDRTPAPGG
ncbi:MAG: TMEM175 family protein [Microthrixaceae bacterium]